MFVLDTTETLGDVLVVWAVDFPSSVVLSKMEIANRIRLLLPKNTLPPNLVIGDFNMTGRSSAIDTIFPDLTDASKTAGSGLMASFPMEFPLYHIDHILVSKDLISVNYELVNPHIGRHRIQIAEIKSN